MRVRQYGAGAPVFLLHGGPGAPGYMAPLARELQDGWRILEPLQRVRGDEPLTVAVHLADLDAAIRRETRKPVTIVGSSWGAMLALCYAAEHPVEQLVLVGCGTFDPMARAVLVRRRRERVPPDVAARIETLETRLAAETDEPEQDRLFEEVADLLFPYYMSDPLTTDLETLRVDYRGHRETWEDSVRLQNEGVYPARFAAIEAPVLMLHGDDDPHPGEMIHRGLEPHVRDLTYRGFPDCGHFPWVERAAKGPFLAALRDALP